MSLSDEQEGMMTPESDNASPPTVSRPRVWTVFVVYLIAAAAAVGVQVVMAVALAVWLLATGTAPQKLADELTALVTTPAVFLLLLLPTQVAVGLAAIVPARLSPEPAFLRLRLVKPVMPAWGYLTVAVASGLPTTVGLGLAYALALVLPPDTTVAALYRQMTWAAAVPFILCIALFPGFMEELLFRGYVQSRLLQRWPAWLAILVTSVLFALLHVAPHAIVFAFPLGLWLGVLAWRTGSVWPGIVCHAFVNGAWNVWQVGRKLTDYKESPPVPVLVGLGVVVLVCFALSCRLLARPHRPPAMILLPA
jgi:membrane protease YdiL (CAAX protease family)